MILVYGFFLTPTIPIDRNFQPTTSTNWNALEQKSLPFAKKAGFSMSNGFAFYLSDFQDFTIKIPPISAMIAAIKPAEISP